MRKITKSELIKFMDTGEEFKLVDVLPWEHFAKEHIKGAISLPVDDIERRASKVLPDKKGKIVTYCASFDCQASSIAAEKLEKLGYTDVLDYKGGVADYKETHRLLEGSLHEKENLKSEACVGCFTC